MLSLETLHLIFQLGTVFIREPCLEGAPDEGLAFPIGDSEVFLLLSAASLCKSVSLLVPGQATMSRDPLYNNLGVLA